MMTLSINITFLFFSIFRKAYEIFSRIIFPCIHFEFKPVSILKLILVLHGKKKRKNVNKFKKKRPLHKTVKTSQITLLSLFSRFRNIYILSNFQSINFRSTSNPIITFFVPNSFLLTIYRHK